MNNYFKDKNVVIMGLGTFGGGVDSALFAASQEPGNVLVTDLASHEKLAETLQSLEEIPNIEFRLGEHKEKDFERADVVIVNPAVPPGNKFVEIARNSGAKITSAVELFFELFAGTIVGVTGSNGKSTTTSLTAHILSNTLDRPVHLSGNIGKRPLLCALEQMGEDAIAVLELSSFQLEQLACSGKAPHVSVITNMTPNHLDRHGTFENYCRAKENIFIHQNTGHRQGCVSIFNASDPVCRKWYDKYKRENGRKCVTFSASDVSQRLREVYKLPGKANLENLAAAAAVGAAFNIGQDECIDAVGSFKALADRLELVGELNGVRWYNDTISTTPDSSITALNAFQCPVILIAGGYDKQLPFDEMGKVAAEKAKVAILIGNTAGKIAAAIETAPGSCCKTFLAESLEHAVQYASQNARQGEVVVLSPGCASYDMFDNYRHRGRVFKESVEKLM